MSIITSHLKKYFLEENIGSYLTDITFLLVMFCGYYSKDKENKRKK